MRFVCLAVLIVSPLSVYASAINVDLGTASSFAVLAGSTVTNTGATVIDGNVGLSPGSQIVGFPPAIVVPPSTEYVGESSAAVQAKADLTMAYNFAAGESCSASLPGNLGGLTLTPGVYCNSSTVGVIGTGANSILTLNDEGDPNAVFVFQIGSTLNTISDSSVVFADGSQGDVYWQVGTSATLGSGTSFVGNILALDSITLDTGANIVCGSALTQVGAVTLDASQISIGCASTESPSPEPSTALMLLLSGASALLWLRKPRSVRE
jgi:hypothetical protein